jgi:hypothetical protein
MLTLFPGNKTDRDDREIPSEVGDEFAQRHAMYFLETSAKASDNVEKLFTEIAHELLQVNLIVINHAYINYVHMYLNTELHAYIAHFCTLFSAEFLGGKVVSKLFPQKNAEKRRFFDTKQS